MSICPTTGKKKYDSELSADKGLDKMKERLPDYDGESYYCFYCDGYHFGRKKDIPVKSRRKRT